MIGKKITELTQKIQQLEKKEFRKYLATALGVVGIVVLLSMYYIYHTSSSLIKQIRTLHKQSHQITQLLAQYKQLAFEEEKIKALLDKNPDFDMNIYFESFLAKHTIKPETTPKPEEGDIIEGSQPDAKYQEVILNATFKKQTMQKLVSILQDIYKKEIIYLKSLEIEAEKKKINFELTLATKQYKKEREEE